MQIPSASARGVGPRQLPDTVGQVLPEADDAERVAAYHFVVKRSYRMVHEGTLEQLPNASPLVTADTYYDGKGPMTAPLRCPSELVPPKPACDVVVHGHARAPGGEATEVICGVSVADHHKRARVVGDRYAWRAAGRTRFSPPRTFSAMPLRWELAYGGVDTSGAAPMVFAANPLGCGYWAAGGVPEAPPQWTGFRPPPHAPRRYAVLPNFLPESPWPGPEQMLIEAEQTDAVPDPVGFGWRSRHWHGVEGLNLAPAGQIVPFPHPGDWLRLENLHPTHRQLALQLPADPPRLYWNAGWGREPVKLSLDTVSLEPDLDRVDLVWRGTMAISEARRTAAVVPRLLDVDGVFLPWTAQLDQAVARPVLEA